MKPARTLFVRILSGVLLLALYSGNYPVRANLGPVSPAFGRWSPPLLLATGAYAPVLAAANNGSMLVYNQATSGTYQQTNPSYRFLPAGSSDWSGVTASFIHEQELGESLSQVAVGFDTFDNAHAVWRSNTAVVYAAQAQWASNAASVVFDNQPRFVQDPDMAIGNDNVPHIVAALQDQTGTAFYNVHHAYFDGNNWIRTKLIQDTPRSAGVRVAVDEEGHVHVVWEERTSLSPEKYEIFYIRGTKVASGYSWGSTTSISGNLIKAQQPAILIEGNSIHVTFTRYEADDEQYIYHTQKPSGGNDWSPPQDITNDQPLAVNLAPRIMSSNMTICRGKLSVFYFGGLAANTREQIFQQIYHDGQWHNRETVTDDSARRIRPAAVCHNNRLHLVYEQIITPLTNHAVHAISAYEQLFLPLLSKN